MGVIGYKIWSDLWSNKNRTLQVVLIIAIGAAAIGMIVTTRTLVISRMQEIWEAANPAMITMSTYPSIDDDTITALKRIEGLENVEGFSTESVEWRLNPDDEWSSGRLIARDDYKNQHYTTLGLIKGEWPTYRLFGVGQGGDEVYGIRVGSEITIRVNDNERQIKIGSIIYDPIASPPSFGGRALLFATHDRMGDLTGDQKFNRIMARATAEYDEAEMIALADLIKRKLEKQEVDSGGASPPQGSRVSDPNKHFFQDTMDGIFMILAVMSIVALILGLFLVYNTINAIISQQVDQIGVMKAIGAGTGQILLIYLLNVLVYGSLALLISIPLASMGGWRLHVFLMNTFNADPGTFTIVSEAVMAQVAIALLAPLFASLIPIFTGVRITVREAISSYGLSAGAGLLERLLAKSERLPRLFLLTISNTFRNKGRVILTQITLVISGLIFMMVMSVGDSTRNTFDDVILSILKYDVSFVFEDSERIQEVEKLTLIHPVVKAVEMWNLDNGNIRPIDQAESDDDQQVTLFGVPLPTSLYGPHIRAGRWLQPGDTEAIVLNQRLAERAGLKLGDWVTIDHGIKGETDWQVVGLVFDPVVDDSAHISRESILRKLNRVGRSNTVWIQTVQNDPDSQVEAAHTLRKYYDQHELTLRPGGTFVGQDTASEATDRILSQYSMIITLLAVMAVVIAVVGSIALSGVLSLNVLERTREIGVMRAVGASSGSIARIFIGEGLLLGWLSWVIAAMFSVPAGRLMTDALGSALSSQLVYIYKPTGALYWLIIITILSIIASWLPARRATRISVRDSLTYQ
ncbi:ABC transporter permease [Anaerolineales bacterium HSG24]|nr:ABC transporter permease [Anaerolineales bacterium HSG24]